MHHVLFGLLLPFAVRYFFHWLNGSVLVIQLLSQLYEDLLWLFLCGLTLYLLTLMTFLVLGMSHLLRRLLSIFLLVLWLLLDHELPILV